MSNIRNLRQIRNSKLSDISADFQALGFQCGISQGKNKVIRHGEKTQGFNLIRRNEDNEGFVVSWIIQGETKCESPEGEYHLFDSCVSIRRPGHKYIFTFNEEKEHLRYYLRISEAAYNLIIQIHPALDIIPPVRILPYREDLVQRFQVLIDRMLRISKTQLLDLMPDMVSLIFDLTGINVMGEQPMEKARRLLEQVNGLDNLRDIATACNLSYAHFRRKFTETYGVSPGQYRIRYRISEAKKMLIEGYSIKEVAHYLSYPDPYTFAHQFKNITGISPREYRCQCTNTDKTQ